MDSRLQRLRQGLSETGCDAFFSLSPPSNEYLTGFRGSASAVIITPSEALFLCDFRYTEQAKEQVTGGRPPPEDEQGESLPADARGQSLFEVTEVSGTLETHVGKRLTAFGASAAAFDPAVLTVQQRNTVAEAFQGALKPEPSLLQRLRQCKDSEEIDRIRAASVLAEGVLLDLLGELIEGLRERELAARIEYEFKLRGALGAAFDPIVLFGSRSSLPHGTPGEKPLERGDIVLIDMGCVRASYCSDLTRTYLCGTIPPSWFVEVYDTVLRAQAAALEAIRPGVACRDVDAAARGIIREAGFGDHFGHGLGHGVGLEVHEAPRLNVESNAVLETGMVVTVEPGIYLPGRGGVRIEDLVVVTEDGCEVLTQSSKAVKVLEV